MPDKDKREVKKIQPSQSQKGNAKQVTMYLDTIPAVEITCMMVSTTAPTLFLDHPNRSPCVILKVVPAVLHGNNKQLETYAILDGSERSIILPAAAKLWRVTLKFLDFKKSDKKFCMYIDPL